MKKFKLFAFGTLLVAMGTFSVSYFGASEVDAQSSSKVCEWNGNDCKSPQRTNTCACEQPAED